jgi:hypothetical protein
MQAQLKLYNILAIPSLSYGCEIRTLKQRDIRRLKEAKMKFIRCKARHNLLGYRIN